MPTIITAGDASNGAVVTPSNDGAVTIQTGAAGAKVNAIALAADGTMTLNKPMAGGSLTLGTAQNTTSGTAIDFTGIPSWVKRITVNFNQVSTSGTSQLLVRIGSGSIDATSYNSNAIYSGGVLTDATGFVVGGVGASDVRSGSMILNHIGSNIWIASGSVSVGTNVFAFGGAHATGGTLDRIRLIASNGTDTFDAGSVNILYEG